MFHAVYSAITDTCLGPCQTFMRNIFYENSQQLKNVNG